VPPEVSVVSTHGAGTAKTVRSVLSGMCALAVRHDALTVNPVREIRLTSSKPKDAPRALTIAEARQLLAWEANSTKVINWTVAPAGSSVTVKTSWQTAGGTGGFFEKTFGDEYSDVEAALGRH
jgi:hypothetical protein